MIDQDADDNKFVDCALNGQANFLVTDDKHFDVLSAIVVINLGFIHVLFLIPLSPAWGHLQIVNTSSQCTTFFKFFGA